MLGASHIVTLSVGAMLLAGCNRFSEAKLIGTWRAESDDGIEEIFLKSDHAFRTLDTFKKELVTPGVIEELGRWHVEGDQLKFDGTVTWSKKPSQTTMRLVQITRDTLVIRRHVGKLPILQKKYCIFSVRLLESARKQQSEFPCKKDFLPPSLD